MKINYRTTDKLTRAGLALIEYTDKYEEPFRKKDMIALPLSGWEIYQASENFDQFLLISHEKSKDYRYHQQSCWFGGTDELPFLVEMRDNNWLDIWKEDKFHETIIPDVIKELQKNFGGMYKRQGDIFAYELPKELQDIAKIQSLLLINDGFTNMYIRDNPKSIFQTRHMLVDGDMTIHYKNPVARGRIKAPDHEDLVLTNWHVLGQTKFLAKPIQAD